MNYKVFGGIIAVMISVNNAEVISLKRAIELSSQSEESKNIDSEYESNSENIEEFISYSKPKLSFSTRANFIDNSAVGQAAQMGCDIKTLFPGDPTDPATASSPDRLKGMSYGWNLNGSQTLNLFRINSTKSMAAVQLSIIVEKKEQQKEDLKIKVIEMYWNSLLAQEEYIQSDESEKWQKDQYEKAIISLEYGQISKIDFDLVKSMYKLSSAQKKSKEAQRDLGFSQLKNIINIDGDIELEDNLAYDIKLEGLALNSDNNKDLKVIRYQAKFNELNADYEKAGYYPDLELIGSVSNSLIGYDTEKWSVLNDYANPDFFNYSIGLQLNWNLYSGGNTTAKIKQYEITSRLQNRQANILKKELDVQLKLIYGNLINLNELIQAQGVYAKSLKATLESDRIEFQNAQISLSGVIQSEKNYSEARKVLLSQKKSWLVSKLSFEKLSGNDLKGKL